MVFDPKIPINMINSTKKLLCMVAIALCSWLTLSAQIKGRVLDAQTNVPLIGVNVYLTSNKGLTATNAAGEYVLLESDLQGSADSISFSHIGYFTQKLSKQNLHDNDYLVLLVPSTQRLGEVIVEDKMPLLKSFISFKKMASMPHGLSSFGSTLYGGKLYVTGGDASYVQVVANNGDEPSSKLATWFYSDRLYTYDVEADSWEENAVKLDKRAYHATHYYDGKLFILGGKRFSTSKRIEYLDEKIEMFDLKTGKLLVEKHTNPHQAVNFSSFAYRDNIIVMGGSIAMYQNDRKVYSKKAHLFNLRTGYWYELPDMPTAKEVHGIVIGKTIYLFGGYNGLSLKSIDTYDVEWGVWKTVGELEFPVTYASVATDGRMIYILGSNTIQEYNMETGQVKAFQIELPTEGGRMFYAKNKLYVLGGKVNLENPESVERSSGLYSISMDEFKKTDTCKYK